MSQISRRKFCGLAAGIAAGFANRTAFAKLPKREIPNVAAIDRQRILTAADQYLTEQPVTITAYSSPRSAGGKHDYFSEGDYWWPDLKNPNGPYIQHDGMSNPDNFNAHRLALIRLSVQVPALAAAWQLTREKRYSQHAAEHLRAWFLDPATMMNPNLQYAQAIHGITTGRGTGIIDTLHLVEVVRSIRFLERARAFSPGESAGLRKWFSDYVTWMATSKNGIQERDAKNNHGTCWVAQAAEFATFTGQTDITGFCRTRFKEVIVPNQIAADGSFPLELARTKPYGYCIFNLDVMSVVCQILSAPHDNLFSFTSPEGRSFANAMAFMFPFIADKSKWPYKHDVEYWDDWPVRQPSLLFAGIALGRAQYFPVWRSLNPDPTVAEIIRNYPIRQPLLWVT
ncbi:MAG TPA: alginate lyase family protein [Candidatus Aquilonibacter sp.]|nr:alginate lyase family protein [Candidatus Aquilonibacter sp.]